MIFTIKEIKGIREVSVARRIMITLRDNFQAVTSLAEHLNNMKRYDSIEVYKECRIRIIKCTNEKEFNRLDNLLEALRELNMKEVNKDE